MKKIYLFSKACLLAAMMIVAFSCKDEEAIVTPIFPEGETVETVVPGTEYTLTFSANMDWELRSSALWCLFSNGFQSVKGEAGEVSQKITITGDAWTLEAATANITLVMGEEEKVIATYTRDGLVPTVTNSVGEVYSEENPCVIAFSQDEVRTAFDFVANFDWVLDEETDIPEWCKLEGEVKGGNAGEEAYVAFSVPEEYWMQNLTGTIVIKNTEIEGCVFNVPVRYDGFPEGELMINGVEGSPYWWTIAADGLSFWKESTSVSGGSPEIETKEIPFSFKVIAKDNAYKVVHVERSGKWLNVIDDAEQYATKFITINDDEQGNVTIESVSSNDGEERDAYILVMPTTVYDDMMTKVNAAGGIYDGILTTPEGDGINTGSDTNPVNYDSYTVFAFKQQSAQATEEGEFAVTNAFAAEGIECVQGDGETGLADYIASEYYVSEDKIYYVSVDANTSISVDPKLTMEEWCPDGKDNLGVIAKNSSGEDIDMKDTANGGKNPWGIGLTSDEQGFVFSNILVKETMFIVFKGEDYKNKKALVVVVNE